MNNEQNSREQRNINVLKLKSQDVKTRYASGKVRVDIRGTEDEMTSNTILAVPSRLISREGVTPAKSIKINNYTQAGAAGKLVSTQHVNLQRNMVDLDEAMNFTISTEGGKISANNINKSIKNQHKPTVEPNQVNETDFGVTVDKPVKARAKRVDSDLVALAKALLKK